MTYGELTIAIKVVQKLSQMNMPVREAYKVYKLSQSLESIRIFCWEQERGMIERHGGTLGQDGVIRFINGDSEEDKRIGEANMNAFVQEIDAFHNTLMEDEIVPITLRLEALDGQELSPSDIAALNGIVTFE